MLAGRGDDRPPAARRARLGERDLAEAAVELARVVAGADDVEREVLEHPDADAVALGRRAVGAAEQVVVDGLGGPREAVAMERAIDDGRDPPAGDRVLAQLEQAGRHRAQVPASCGAECRRERRREERRGALHGRGRRRGRPASPSSAAIEVDAHAGHPARVDELEVGEVDGHVEGDPVVAHAALDAQAERPDLARVRRRPGRTSSRGGRRAGRPRPRARRRSRRGPPRAPGRAAGSAGRAARGRGSGRRPAGPGRDRSPRRRARPGSTSMPRAARRGRVGPDVGRVRRAGRGSGPPGARAAGAGRRSVPSARSATRRFWSASASR